MDKKPTWLNMMKIKLRLGKPFAPVVFLGAVDSYVIGFKDYFVSVMERDGKIVSLGWSKDPHSFPDVNINDFWTATPKSKVEEE